MAVAWPAVRAALAAALPAVVGATVTVYDGLPVTGENPDAYLTIAARPSQDEQAGSFTQDVGPDGFSAMESGTVLGELARMDGTTTAPDVFATFDLIAAYVQANQTLAVLTPGSTLTVSADVEQSQTTAGAVQRLLLTFAYTTRLP